MDQKQSDMIMLMKFSFIFLQFTTINNAYRNDLL